MKQTNCKSVFTCRSCDHPNGHIFLDLGEQPLANRLIKPDELRNPEPRFPLRVFVCDNCRLMQITDLIPPDDLFTDYIYRSSYSDQMLRHAKAAAGSFINRFDLTGDSFVVEIASNDGYLLKNFIRDGIRCLGIEPAANIADIARGEGIDTICEFFGECFARRLADERGMADLILGNNVLAHAPQINDFITGLRKLLKPQGTVVLEFPYGKEMVDKGEFDTIYHEHVFYFTLTALVPAFERGGLEIFDVERLEVHGGSLRLFARHGARRQPSARLLEMLKAEEEAGLLENSYYDELGGKAETIRRDLLGLMSQLRTDGYSVAAYGAAAKGNTLLNYCNPPGGTIDFIADRSPLKHGKLSPGLHVPVVSAEELKTRRPDYTLLLAWNFAAEILAQQTAYRNLGGKFIIPIPEVRIA